MCFILVFLFWIYLALSLRKNEDRIGSVYIRHLGQYSNTFPPNSSYMHFNSSHGPCEANEKVTYEHALFCVALKRTSAQWTYVGICLFTSNLGRYKFFITSSPTSSSWGRCIVTRKVVPKCSFHRIMLIFADTT
jgi:hypothetical protein